MLCSGLLLTFAVILVEFRIGDQAKSSFYVQGRSTMPLEWPTTTSRRALNHRRKEEDDDEERE